MCVYCKEEFEYTCTHSQENMALLPWYYCRVERDEKMAVLVLNFDGVQFDNTVREKVRTVKV